MGKPSEEAIIEALRSSGYLFEADVAALLWNLDFHVDTSWAYLDPKSAKSREIDVRALKRVAHSERHKLQVFAELLVECKSYDSPLVFLENLKNKRERHDAAPGEYVFPVACYRKALGANSYQEIPPFVHLGLREHHYYYREHKKATQFAKVVRKGKDWVANHDGIYDALILPIAKVLEFRKAEVRKHAGGDWNTAWLFFPMVVLSDQLYAYDLSVAPRALSPRPRISFVRHLESGTLKGFYLIDFVRYDCLGRFVAEEISEYCGVVAELVEKQPRILLDRESA